MKHLGILVAGLLLFASPALAVGLNVTPNTIAFKSKYKEIDVVYPVTGKKNIDAPIADYAKQQSRLIEEINGEDDPPPGDMKYTVAFSYHVDRNDAEVFSVSMSGDAFTGGAHGIQFMENFHFLMPDGWRVYLPELVDGSRGIKRISEIAVTQLRKQLLTGKDDFTNEDWIKGGAGPDASNFNNFVWGKDKLSLIFMPYQVGPYVMGATEIDIPMSQIRSVIRTDPRAPSPSFACSAATAPVEKAICSDALLARADRFTAEAYTNRMNGAGGEQERAEIRKLQRDFIFMRDKSCGVKIDCLKKAYENRLAVLKKL